MEKFSKKLRNFFSRVWGVPVSQKIFFVQNLALMLRAGISLSKALQTLADQTTNYRFNIILGDVAGRVEKGETFAKSLRQYPKVFSELFVSMVQAGELTGNLEEILQKLYVQMKKDHELISKIKGAMTYPAIVVIAMISVGIGMITFVIPRITSIFKEINIDLPLPTKILIAISDFVVNNGLLVAIGSILLVAVFFKFIKSKFGQPKWHYLLLKLPIISGVIKKVNLARFGRTLSGLLKTNIPISKTLKTTSEVLGNAQYREALKKASEKIEKGVMLSDILAPYPHLFPSIIEQMIKVGEQTGTLDTILDEIANFYEEEVNNVLNNITTIIEPILILLLGVGVAFMAIAVIMPIYSISQQI